MSSENIQEGMCDYCNTIYHLENGKLPEHKTSYYVTGLCYGSGKIPGRLVVENEFVDNPEYAKK